MDPEIKNFGRGPKELTGAVDLLNFYKLLPHYNFFCKKSLPLSISDTHYLHDVIGDSEIRKGEGMQLNQLLQNNNTSFSRDTNTRIQPFDFDLLKEAFHLKESAHVDLPSSEKGIPTISGKSRSEIKEKEKKHKKHKDKEHKKHKHRHKDKEKDKEKKKNKSSHHEKKRKHDGNEDVNDIHKHKKSKHKSSKIDEIGGIKIAA